MARPRGPRHGEGGDTGDARRRGSHPGGPAGSVSQAQEFTAREAQRGRAGSAGTVSGRNTPLPGHPDELVTLPTGELGGTPDGSPTRIGSDQDVDVRRALELENSAAGILADQGHRIRQNPTADEVAQARLDTGDVGRASSRPDYLIEGRVFDCYAPKERTSARNIWAVARRKVESGQTQRLVVDLEDWRGDLSALRVQFKDWPVDTLKEVKVIMPDRQIIQIIPDPEQD